MSDHPTPPRLYGEEEVGRILERAAGLHGERQDRSSGSSGEMSLAELEEIALEAGIDPVDLRRAAMELGSGDVVVSGWDRLAGEQLTLIRETIIPGEITQPGFERVITAVRQDAGELGQSSLLGRTLTWQTEASDKMLVVTLRDGETHIRIEERLDQTAGLVFSCAVGGVGAGVGLGAGLPLAVAFGSVLLGTLFPLGLTGLSYIGARRIYRALVGKRRKAIDEMMELVTREVTSAISSASLQGAERPKQVK